MEHVLEVPAAEDEGSVEAVGANGTDPALGEGVRVRRLDEGVDHLDALAAENLVEGVAELRIASDVTSFGADSVTSKA